MEFKSFLEQAEGEWKATKDDILSMWKNLQPNLPLRIDPVPAIKKGSRYDVDGIRVTGKPLFISSVLSRLKDVLQYEQSPVLKLDVSYAKTASKSGDPYKEPTYVCYIYVVEKDNKHI
jgi:hypothetical protein